MEKVINLDKDNIVSSIQNITGYTGRNIVEGLDRVSATSDEEKILDDLTSRALIALLSTISTYKPSVSNYQITINIPSNFDINGIDALKNEFENFIVNSVCAEWFIIAREKEDGDMYTSYKNRNIINIIALLSRRIKPNN